jgi:hypothetical protein
MEMDVKTVFVLLSMPSAVGLDFNASALLGSVFIFDFHAIDAAFSFLQSATLSEPSIYLVLFYRF